MDDVVKILVRDAAGSPISDRSEIASETATLGILTLNMGLLSIPPFRLWSISSAPNINRRLSAAPRHLRAIGADVIALQEIYAGSHCRFLQRSLREDYPHVFVPPKNRSLLGPGLMFLSRFAIRRGAFFPLRRFPTVHDVIAEKGCLCIEVEVPKIGLLRLITVHLAHDRTPPDEGANSPLYFAEIDHLLSVARSPQFAPAILLGDFNCSEMISPSKYRRIKEAGYVDAFAALAPPGSARSAVTWDADNPINAAGRHRHAPSQRIDCVFVPDALHDKVELIASAIEFNKPTIMLENGAFSTLSDHYGMSVRIALK